MSVLSPELQKLYPFGIEPVLDLDWCIVRQPSMAQWVRIGKMARPKRRKAILAFSAGYTVREFDRLPEHRREELHLACNWVSMPYRYPPLGRPIIE